MKKTVQIKLWLLRITMVTLFSGIATSLLANRTIYIPDFIIKAGETKKVAIQVSPYFYKYLKGELGGELEFTLRLPDGLTLVKDFHLYTPRKNTYRLESNVRDSVCYVNVGFYNIVDIYEASGDFLYFSIIADNDFNGTQEIRLDYTIEVRHYLCTETNKGSCQTKVTALYSAEPSNDNFYIPNFSIKAGETKELAIQFESDNVNSSDPSMLNYVALQFDLYLPEGLTVVQKKGKYNFTFNADRCDDHTFSSALQTDGAIRVLAASLSNANFWETSGDFIYFSVTADADFSGNQEIVLKNIMFSTTTGRTSIEDAITEVTGLPTDIDVASITLDKSTIELTEGETATLTATVTPSDATNKTVTWITSDATIATVENGVVRTLKPGEVTITAKAGEFIASCKVKINHAQFTLTYMLDGIVYKKSAINYGSALIPEANPVKEGYTFSGWSEVPSTMPAKDVTIEGTFTVNNYNLVYMVDGVEFNKTSVEFGAAITALEAPTKEGYTFSGWSEVPSTMPAKDVTITGTFSVNSYNLVYMVDGVEFNKTSVEFGAAITALEAPTKEGYTFSGWSEVPSTMPANDVTIEGSFTVNSYNLVYMVDGVEFNKTSVEFGSTITALEAPTKEGYTFSGWSEVPSTMPAKDVTITGTFSVNSYNLVYMVDGVEFNKTSVEFGSTITALEAPTKEGYTFSGWNEVPSTMPAKDVTITGTFSVNSYNLVYMVDGVEFNKTSVEFGAAITALEAPTKEGYTFCGWSEIPETMPANDVTIEGSFSINSYNLVYMVDGVEFNKTSVEFGSAITALEAPTKEGYTFSGWNEVPSTMPAKDVTITGTFSVNSYNLVYMVDGVEFNKTSVEFGAAITALEAPTKEGYTFCGWSEIPETMPANDVTIEGSFSINSYNLVYMVDGVEFNKTSVEFGAAITALEAPTKEGYTFSGWSEVPSTMPAKDVTIEGTFSVNSYNLVYMVDGVEFNKTSVEFGAAITALEVPTKEGYTFSGWSEIPSTMPAKDVTITGTFSANCYNLVYMVDGVEFNKTSVEFGAAITALEAPTKEGYTFCGWSEIPETMPANDVTIEGSFSINTYTITYMVDGEVYATEQITYGSTITLKDAPVKEGYIFSGWSEAPETMPAVEVVIEGTFTVDGIDAVVTNRLVDVYTLQGVMVKRQIPVEELEQELPSGIYIVDSKKMVIK